MQVNENLKHFEQRILKFKEYIALQQLGPEVDTEKKLLNRLENHYETLKNSNEIFIAEATSNLKLNCFPEETLIQNLGAIYWIFGPAYEETISFKRYRIEFLHVVPNERIDHGCMFRVSAHIYENEHPLITNAQLEFWKSGSYSTEVDDIGISYHSLNQKYKNIHWFSKMAYTLARTWNYYFQSISLREAKRSGLLESHSTNGFNQNAFDNVEALEHEALEILDNDTIDLIQKFASNQALHQALYARDDELEFCIPIKIGRTEPTLLYALTSGTAYTIHDNDIYIWYKPSQTLNGSAFYKLKRFLFLNNGRTVKYFLNKNTKL